MTNLDADETTSLLRQETITNPHGIVATVPSKQYGVSVNDQAYDNDTDETNVDATWASETTTLAWYSSPLVLTYVLQYSFNAVTVLVAGRLGTTELAATSLASMIANVTGLAIFEGLATSLDTLTAQAYGAGKKQLVGLHVQRMILLTLFVTIPIGLIWICSPWILARLIPETQVAYLAGDFLRFYLIGAPGYGVFEALKRFTQAQGDYMGAMFTVLISAPLNIFWNWLFVFKLGLGFRGAGIAVSVSNLMQPLIFLVYVTTIAPDTLQCWPGFQVQRAFQNWKPMIDLAIPGVVMILSEWLAFDILTFTSSYLSETHLAAQSVCYTIAVMMYHIPFPISVAASTRFGNLIGMGDLITARVAFNTYYVIFLGIGVFDVILLTSLRHTIAEYFTNDDAVKVMIIRVLPMVAAAQMFDSFCAISNGLTRGLGRQKIAGWTNLGVYYLFAIPLSLLLTFGPPRLELVGLWTGPLIGLGMTALILWFYMHVADWGKAVEEARCREE